MAARDRTDPALLRSVRLSLREQAGVTMAVAELRRQTADGRLLFGVDGYYRMAEIGTIHEDSRVELLGGELRALAPIGSLPAPTTGGDPWSPSLSTGATRQWRLV